MRTLIQKLSLPWHVYAFASLVALGLVLRLLSAYYAPFTVDEAYSLENYAKLDPSIIISSYDIPNNHILNNVLTHYLSYLSLHWFVLRLPAIIGSLVFLWSLYKLLVPNFSPFVSVASISVLSLHPYILALSVSSRGYGMAMGFLMAGTYLSVQAIETRSTKAILLQSLCFLISALSIPSFIIGVAMVYLAQVICFFIRKFTWQAYALCIVSGLLIASLTYVIYFLRLSQQGNWAMHVFGTTSVQDAVSEMTYLITNRKRMGILSSNQLFFVLAMVCVWGLRMRPDKHIASFIFLLVAAGSPVLFVIVHLVMGANFPQSRAWVFFFICLVPVFFECIEWLAKAVRLDKILDKWQPSRGIVSCLITFSILYPELSTYQMRIIGQPEASEYSIGLGELLARATSEHPSPTPHICIHPWYADIVRYYQRAWDLNLKVDCNPDTSDFLILNRYATDATDRTSLHRVIERTDRLLAKDDLSGLTLYSVLPTQRPSRPVTTPTQDTIQ